MARHGLGLNSAPTGLGFVRETNTGAAAAAVVPRPAAPVGGGVQQPLDDIIRQVRANAARPRTAPAAPPRAGRGSGIPQFQTDPIAAVGFVLREVGAGLQGRELPSARIAKEERERETFELRRFQVGLDAVDQFSKLSGTQRAAAAAGFNARFGEFLGIDFSTLSATIEIDDVIPIVKGIDPSLLTAFADDPEKLRDVALDPQRRAILEEISDGRNLRPAMRKVLAGIEAVNGQLTEQDRGALGDRRFTFQDISQLAEPLGLTAPELAALERNQSRAFPQLSEATGLQFTAAGVLQNEAELVSLDRVRAEADARREPIAAAAAREVATVLAKQRALAPGASEREKDRTELEVATALRKQKLLAPGRIAETRATEAAKAEFREPKGKAVNILLPDGKRATGRELPGGELKIVGEGGVLAPAPPGALKMTLQASPGELPDKALNRKVIQSKATATSFVRMAQETLTFLQNPKTVLGGAGGTIRFASGLLAQGRQLAAAFSDDHFDAATAKDLSVAEILDPGRYKFDGLQAIAAANTRVKANAVAMAYMVARSRDPSGRLSDFDVQSALDSLGFQSNDKDIIAATLSDRVREVTENSANFIESVTGARPDLPTLPAAPAPAKRKAMTIEELEAIARGRN